MKQEIADILMRKIKDPRIGFVTVTDVEVADDLRNATVYVSVYGGDAEKEATLKGLRSAAAFIRSELGKRMRMRLSAGTAVPVRCNGRAGSAYHGTAARDRRKGKERTTGMSDCPSHRGGIAERCNSFLLSVHKNPDGDALGSQLALDAGARKAGQDGIVAEYRSGSRDLSFSARARNGSGRGPS